MPTFRPLLISAVIGSLTLVGCAQPNGKPMITFMKNAQPLSGKWYGQATCSNGEVSKLSLDVNGTASGKLSGALAIVQSNNRSGVYSFNGQFEQDATFRLTPVQWQQKTGNLSSLPLTGKADDVNQPTVIRGNVPECGGTFELGRKPIMTPNVVATPINDTNKTIASPNQQENYYSKYTNADKQCTGKEGAKRSTCLNKNGFTLFNEIKNGVVVKLGNGKTRTFKNSKEIKETSYIEFTKDNFHVVMQFSPENGEADTEYLYVDYFTGKMVSTMFGTIYPSPDRKIVADVLGYFESSGSGVITLSDLNTGKTILNFEEGSEISSAKWLSNDELSYSLKCQDGTLKNFSVRRTGNKWIKPVTRSCI